MEVPESIVVDGSTIEEAVSRGAYLLGLSYREIAWEQVCSKEGQVKVRVYPKDISEKPWEKEEVFDKKGEDGKVVVKKREDGKEAYIVLIPPKDGGQEVSFENVMKTLRKEGVVVGVKEEIIKESLEAHKFNEEIKVAEYIPPVKGEDSYIDYKFKVDSRKIELDEDEHGRVDFKELHLIQNVKAGQILAEKIPPRDGIPGKLVDGREILPPKPKESKLPRGKNTEISKDGTRLIASIDGHVVMRDERVCVEPIYEVNGDVDLNTGNIHFFGTVIIRGDVKSGFSVEASGDIIVYGGVENASLSADREILIFGGIRRNSHVKASGEIKAKFIENATLSSKKNITVGKEIMHSEVYAKGKISVGGGRGSIIGGRICAGVEVIAQTIGSPSTEVPTRVEVGVDPYVRQELDKLEEEFAKDKKIFEELKLEIEKTLREKNESLPHQAKILNHLLSKLQARGERIKYLKEKFQDSCGKIVILGEAYPGVKISVGTASILLKEEWKRVIFTSREGEIEIKPY